jgi:hypothetical protein
MNMPSRKGEMVHQIVCRYPVESIESFLEVINESDFILVEEFYRKPDNAGFFPVGMVIINTMHIGKVKVELSST